MLWFDSSYLKEFKNLCLNRGKDNIEIIMGQEAVCPDGLGRVIDYHLCFPHSWIQVSTYVNDRSSKWAIDNVKLVPLRT